MNYGYAVMFVGFAVLVGVYVYDLVETSRLRKTVWHNLDNAWDGGCFNAAEAGYLHEMTTREIAEDMTLYCDDVGGYDCDELEPHVRAWLERNAQKVYPT